MSSLFADDTMKFPPPREFQRRAMVSIAEGVVGGHKNQMLMAPTGAGKTYLGLRVAHKVLKRGKRATFLCDRVALIDQTSYRAEEYGLTAHGIIQADHPRQDWSQPLQIASVQTVASRGWPKTDVLIVDEAHTMHKTWLEHAAREDVQVIGLSATPFSRGLGKIFSNLISAATMHELTQDGTLVPMRVLSCRRPNMEGAKVNSKGEWQEVEAAARGMQIIGDVVTEWTRHAQGRKTIVFGATIAHCEELCRQFNEAGIMAACYTDETRDRERKQLLEEFRRTDASLRVLISVDALAKGFDVQDVGCVVDCRPLRKSLSTAIQMWGRGLRESKDTGKQECILLDHSGNITRFAEDFTHVFFHGLDSLDDGEKLDRIIRKDEKDERERKGCPSCGYKPFRQRCMSCGFEIQAKSLVTHEAGEMQEVVLGKSKIEMHRADLWLQLCSFARDCKNVQRKAGFAYNKFRELTGTNPPRWPRYDNAEPVAVDPVLEQKLKGQMTSWRIRQAAIRKKGDAEAMAA